MGTLNLARGERTIRGERGNRFYRPELDALRLFAFLGVLIHHGAARPGAFLIVRKAGAFGLSLFFLLSAYLITELLLREREKWGTVHLKSFYVRRVLRIWPLYFTALLACIAIAKISHQPMQHMAIAGFALFIANWVPRAEHVGFFGAMWSISIEEQFYVIWPVLAKWRGRASVAIASAILITASAATIVLLSFRTWMLWYNTFVEFLFFGTGALLAIFLGEKAVSLKGFSRLPLFAAGLASWGVAAGIGVGTDRVPALTMPRLYIGYGAADLGAVLIFLAFLGASSIPRPIVYLGKISYGLYVVHLFALSVTNRILPSIVTSHAPLWQIAAVDGLAFLISVGLAAFSYRFLEKPFLKLKERFAFVKSRPAD